eukprot:3938159-Rhodomonas_salina.6
MKIDLGGREVNVLAARPDRASYRHLPFRVPLGRGRSRTNTGPDQHPRRAMGIADPKMEDIPAIQGQALGRHRHPDESAPEPRGGLEPREPHSGVLAVGSRERGVVPDAGEAVPREDLRRAPELREQGHDRSR